MLPWRFRSNIRNEVTGALQVSDLIVQPPGYEPDVPSLVCQGGVVGVVAMGENPGP